MHPDKLLSLQKDNFKKIKNIFFSICDILSSPRITKDHTVGNTELSNILIINLIVKKKSARTYTDLILIHSTVSWCIFACKTSQISYTQQTSGHVLFEEIKQNLDSEE